MVVVETPDGEVLAAAALEGIGRAQGFRLPLVLLTPLQLGVVALVVLRQPVTEQTVVIPYLALLPQLGED